MSEAANITRIRAVYRALGNLGDSVVFVGGATVSLYKDKPAMETRVTDDVDIAIELMQIMLTLKISYVKEGLLMI